MSAYSSLRLANEILHRAATHNIEENFMVVRGDQWVNGQLDDDVEAEFPEFSRAMCELVCEYDDYALIKAFELLIELA